MIEERKKKIKSMIETLINDNKLEDAKLAIEDYKKVVPDDIDIYSMLGVIYILKHELDDAKEILLEGLLKDESNFDINYNLAFIAEAENNKTNAYYFYKRAYEICSDADLKNQIDNKLKILLEESRELLDYNRTKLAIFCIKGLDNFLYDIIVHLLYDYEVKLVLVSNNEELRLVDKWMEWADICWFEWCNELAVYGSRLPIAKERKVICRLHSYEAFTDNIKNVNWENIDKVIFVSENLKQIVTKKVNIEEDKIEVIPNGINLKKWTFKQRDKGYNIAYVGYINYKKGPMLLLHTFKAIYDKDNRYKLYIAGEIQDERYVLYFNQMIKELGLENNVFFEGWQNDLDKWLEDKNYILCTSLLESQNLSVMQAMAKGIKPIVHNFAGAKDIYPKNYLWNLIDEAVKMILLDEHNSNKYRKFIEDRYSLTKQITKIKNVLRSMLFNKEKEMFLKFKYMLGEQVSFESIDNLTIVIPTYNRANLLKEDLTYGHKLGNQNKIIVDDCSNTENKNILTKLLLNKKSYGIEEIIFNDVNKGVAASISVGIKNVKTKYMALCGDDDKLFCLNKDEFKGSINRLNDDCLMIIPRYVINLDSYDNITVGYDRKKFDNKFAYEILELFFKTGEIEALAAGLITNTDLSRECLPEDIFKISEDYVLLSRLLAKNQNKKIKVLDSYIYIRRINDFTLSKTINIDKLSIHLLSMLVSGFYCLKFNIITRDELFIYLNKRAELIQNIYGFGMEYINLVFHYLTKKINLNEFVNINKNRYIKEMDLENIPKELVGLIKLI